MNVVTRHMTTMTENVLVLRMPALTPTKVHKILEKLFRQHVQTKECININK